MEDKQDGYTIKKYVELNTRLRPFKMHIYAWGRLAIVLDSNPHDSYILNNVLNIDVIEGFVKGLEYARRSGNIHEKPELLEDKEK